MLDSFVAKYDEAGMSAQNAVALGIAAVLALPL
jgi:hypothetical protein